MEILQHPRNDAIELELRGRFDAVWADHVSNAIAEAIRNGHHRVFLNMAGVDFLTSMGIRVLIKYRKQLAAIEGQLGVVSPSPFVAEVLGTMGLTRMFEVDPLVKPVESPPGRMAETIATAQQRPMGLVCRVLGDPARVAEGRCDASDCRAVSLPPGVFALGIGTPGTDFSDCQARAGEFLAVNGALAFLPTDHGNVPDHLIAQEEFIPAVQSLHCLVCEGRLRVSFSFQADPDKTLSLLELVERAFDECDNDAVGIVMAAESAGLVGASLRRSPAGNSDGGLFRFPKIRDRIRFTSERAFCSEVALVVGVACRRNAGPLASTVRPLGVNPWPQGHFHAAVFSYCPLRKHGMTVADTVNGLFERESLRGLLHLIHDARPTIGAGQSEFVRGTVWAAPIARYETETERGAG